MSPAKKKAEKSAEPKAKRKRKAKPPPVSLKPENQVDRPRWAGALIVSPGACS